MRKPLENRLTMFYAVKQVCEKHAGAYGDLLPYVNAFDELKMNLKAVEDAIERQEVSLVG